MPGTRQARERPGLHYDLAVAPRRTSLPLPGPLLRLWRAGATPRGFLRLAVAALVGLWVIVPSGALVRLTASGLGCPDWPLCDGRLVPASAGHDLIEWSNRILSALVVALCVVAFLRARAVPGLGRRSRSWALAAALATIGQVPLGAVTVYLDLHPLLVGSHFLLSMVALACGAVLALRAHDHAHSRLRARSRQAILAALVALALGVGLVTGVLVTAAGPHSGDDGAVPRLGRLDDAAWLHVRAVVIFAALALVLAAWTVVKRRERSPDAIVRRLGLATLPLIGAQIAIGEYQYRNSLPWQVVLVHVSIAALLWASTVLVAWRIARPLAAPPPPAPGPPQPRRLEDAPWQETQRIASGTILNRASGIGSPQSTQSP